MSSNNLPNPLDIFFQDLMRWYISEGYLFDQNFLDNRDKDLALEFLLVSKNDFLASRTLYSKKLHAQAIFHLQQSVEKLGKSILLLSGDCNFVELPKLVGHKFSRFILNKLHNVVKSSINYISIDTYRNNLKDTLDMIKYIDDCRIKRRTKPFIFPHKELRYYLSSYKETSKSIPEQINIINNFKLSSKRIIEIFNQILLLDRTIIDDNFSDFTRNELEEYLLSEFTEERIKEELFISIVIINILLFVAILSMNLEKHVSTSRYPHKRNFDYTSNSLIVKIYPLMLKTVKTMVKDYEKILTLLL